MTPGPSIFRSTSLPSYIAVVLIVMLISLWAVQQLTAPYAKLVTAVKAIGEDLNRPPLPEAGSGEVKAAAHAINSMQAKLKDYVAEREHLAAALAHDLRTPLTRMRLRCELLDDPKLAGMLAADIAEIELIARSVVDFASLEHPDEGNEKVDLVSLVQSACDGFDAAELDGAGEPLRLIIDGRPVALRRCIANLVDNAVKYGGRARVAIVSRDGAVEIRWTMTARAFRQEPSNRCSSRSCGSRSRATGRPAEPGSGSPSRAASRARMAATSPY